MLPHSRCKADNDSHEAYNKKFLFIFFGWIVAPYIMSGGVVSLPRLVSYGEYPASPCGSRFCEYSFNQCKISHKYGPHMNMVLWIIQMLITAWKLIHPPIKCHWMYASCQTSWFSTSTVFNPAPDLALFQKRLQRPNNGYLDEASEIVGEIWQEYCIRPSIVIYGIHYWLIGWLRKLASYHHRANGTSLRCLDFCLKFHCRIPLQYLQFRL